MSIKRKPRYVLHIKNTKSNLEKSNSIVTVMELAEIYSKNNGKMIDKNNAAFISKKELDNAYDEFIKRGFQCEKRECEYSDDMIAHWVIKYSHSAPDGFPVYYSKCSECGEVSYIQEFCPHCHRYMCDELDLYECAECFRSIYEGSYLEYMNNGT